MCKSPRQYPRLRQTSCAATIFEYAAFVWLRNISCTTGFTSSSLRVWMQLSIRSLESSSMGAVVNFDWPTRIVEVMTSIASARSAFALLWSGEISENRRTSFVSAPARTAPVKKSPPSRRAKTCLGSARESVTGKRRAYSAMEVWWPLGLPLAAR